MNSDGPSILLITANVGSIFEDPDVLLHLWVDQFLKTIVDLQPDFIALHCQEVGGKNYEISMKHVHNFVRRLLDCEQLVQYTSVRVFLDEDFTCSENFTALGNFYFIHESLRQVKLWNWSESCFQGISGKEIFSGNIESVPLKEKAKFPQDFFPECKWSRKGFMRTRWSITGTIFDLANIHLFHDASNFISAESFPSPYTKNRINALKYTLDRFANDRYGKAPLFIFGDFNFRLDTKSVIERLTPHTLPVQHKCANSDKLETICFQDQQSESKTVLLSLGKKLFDFEEESVFSQKENRSWLLELDKEIKEFRDQLIEMDIDFPPTYPYTEDSCNSAYMKTRCPAWCDRILMTPEAAKQLRSKEDEPSSTGINVRYQIIGQDVPMGDHKPVLLWFRLKRSSGKWLSVFRLVFNREHTSPACNACAITAETCLMPNLAAGSSETARVVRDEVAVDAPMHVCCSSSHSVITHNKKRNRNAKKRIRLRTHSIPSTFDSGTRVVMPVKARRTTSATSSSVLKYHNASWYEQNRALFDALSERCSSSNRLTSHHSSSSEEWYDDIQETQKCSMANAAEAVVAAIRAAATDGRKSGLTFENESRPEDSVQIDHGPPEKPSAADSDGDRIVNKGSGKKSKTGKRSLLSCILV